MALGLKLAWYKRSRFIWAYIGNIFKIILSERPIWYVASSGGPLLNLVQIMTMGPKLALRRGSWKPFISPSNKKILHSLFVNLDLCL